jgi:ribosomal protein S18 acetylase RimI-like enzyme
VRGDTPTSDVVSEFYAQRRRTIRDGLALTGFLLGFLVSAPIGWPYLATGFVDGGIARGLLSFGVIVLGSAVLAAGLGMGVGTVAGWGWQRVHAARRRSHPPIDRDAAARAAAAAAPPRPERDWSIRYDGSGFSVADFLALAGRVWPREYDDARTASALERTTNIGAWDGTTLVGAVRVLTDGYFFATVTELLVDPAYRHRGIGRELMQRALAAAPRGTLFFGAQPQAVAFFERIGAERGPIGFVLRARR